MDTFGGFSQYASDLSNSPSGDTGGFNLGGLLTDLGGAAQVGLGIYNETQGGPAVNTSIGGVYKAGSSVAGAPVPTRFLGFTPTEIVIGILAIVGVILAVHFVSK